jgi:antitoxin ParD1/3/4
MSTMVDLSPELERFAEGCVSSGRFGDMTEVLESALVMLRAAEARRATFVASLEEARAEGERNGFFSIQDVDAHLDSIINEIEARNT